MLSFVYPLFWPFLNLFTMVSVKPAKPVKNVTTGTFTFTEHLVAVAGSWRSALIAYFCMYVLYDDDYEYPAFGRAKNLDLDWMIWILVRNLAGTWLICGLWDWILYFSPLKNKLKDFKMNPAYPSWSQVRHDAAYTTLSSAVAAVLEVGLCHGWAAGAIPHDRSVFERPMLNFVLLSTITHWRIPHFHLIHRGMHPWRTERIPDFGKIAYRHVHSLHHKSYNPTAFSGTSMHPVESSLYYSAALMPVLLGCHPVVAVACIVDLAVGAWLGHDGFQWPGSGDYFHFLHHKHFDCNYGAVHIPLDKLFGTFAAGKGDVTSIWKTSQVGEEFNGTPVHEPGPGVEPDAKRK